MSVGFSSGLLAACLMLAACGGSGVPSDRLNDTWLWNGSDWDEANATTPPPPRDEATVVYYGTTRQVVLFGGMQGSDVLNDTWTWDGRRWTLQHPKTSPSPRFGAVMVFDAARGVVILMAGRGASPSYTNFNEMWTWDGSDWRLLPAPAPFSGFDGEIGYDTASARVVAVTCCLSAKTVTWTWNGLTWQRLRPLHEGGGYFMYGDRASGRLTAMADRVLTWDGADWVEGPQIIKPKKTGMLGPTWPAGFAYDAQRGLVVAFGGRSCQGGAWDESWTWDGASWNLIRPQHRPPGRSSTYMAFDLARGVVVMFGGGTSNGCGGLGA
jgi:hypothetical protein